MRSFSFLLLLSMVIWSCQPDEAPVKSSAEAYLTARLSGDFSTAAKWVTDSSRYRVEDLEMFTLTSPAGNPAPSFSIRKVVFLQNRAAVIYRLEGYGEDTLDMALIGDAWLVDLSSPSSVPDAGVLWQELQVLEAEDTTSRELNALDRVLFEEDTAGKPEEQILFEEE